MDYQLDRSRSDRLDLFAHYDNAERMSLMRILMRCLQCDCALPNAIQAAPDSAGECNHWITRATTLASLSLALLVMMFFITLVIVRHYNYMAETGNTLCSAMSPNSLFKTCSPLY